MELLAFEVSRNACALPLAQVLELLPVPHVTPVPGAPAALRGVVNVRGRVVPVVDLGVRLGGPPAKLTRSSLLLVVDERAEGASARCALLVDAAKDLLRVGEAAIAERPASGPLAGATAVRGLVMAGSGALLVLDLEALLEPESLRRCGVPGGPAAHARTTAVGPEPAAEPEPTVAAPVFTARGTPRDDGCAARAPATAPRSEPALASAPPPSRRAPERVVSRAPSRSVPTSSSRAKPPPPLAAPAPARPAPRAAPPLKTAPPAVSPPAPAAAAPAPPARSSSGAGATAAAALTATERRAGAGHWSTAPWLTLAAAGLAVLVAAGLLMRAPAPSTRASTPTPTPTEAFAGAAVRPERSDADASSRSRRAAADPRTVVVRGGDTLWGLAARHRRDPHSWPLLHQANGAQIRDPDLIRPGQRLVVPE